MKISRMWILVGSLLLTISAQAQSRGWNLVGKDGQTVIFQKFMKMGDVTYPVATVTHSIAGRKVAMSNEDAMKEADRIAEALRATVNQVAWKVKRSEGRVEYAADWKEQNRLVHILYRNFGKRYVVSVSAVRRIYATKSEPESISLQAYLESLNEPLEKKKSASWWPERLQWAALMSSTPAWAQGFNAAPVTASQVTSIASGSLGSNISSAVNLNTGASPVLVIDASNANAQSRQNALDVEAQTYRDANALESKTVSDVDATLTRASSMSHLFQGAFAMGLGSAAAGFVANFVASGVISVVSSLYHDLMGTLSEDDKARMDQASRHALDALDKGSQQLTNLETEIDKRIAALMVIGGTDDAQDLTERVDAALEQADALKRAHITCNMSSPSTIAVLKTIQQWLNGPENTRAGICSKINELLMQWPGAEAQVYQAQQTIRHNAPAILAGFQRSYLASGDTVGGPRSASNYCSENIDDIQDRLDDAGHNNQCIRATYAKFNYNPKSKYGDSAWEDKVAQDCDKIMQTSAKQNLDSIQDACNSAVKNAYNSNEIASLSNGLNLVDANTQAASAKLQIIAQADCIKGEVDQTCDGLHDGSYQQMRQRYQSMYAAAQQQCPGATLFHPNAMFTQPATVAPVSAPRLKKKSTGGIFGWL